MSRLEKNQQTKLKKSKFNKRLRVCFVLFLLLGTTASILAVEYNVNKMIGKEEFNINLYDFVDSQNVEKFVKNASGRVEILIKDIEEKLSK